VYRQEDFVLAEVVRRAGGREGKVADTFHYHQTMYKPTPWTRKLKSVNLDMEIGPNEELRTWNMQVKGIIKYLDPTIPWLINEVQLSVSRLLELNALNLGEFKLWVRETNPAWLPFISRWRIFKYKLPTYARLIYRLLFK
jgi:hypothetical protein